MKTTCTMKNTNAMFKSMLAHLYYPEAAVSTALRWLNEDIRRDAHLMQMLYEVGYTKSTRRLSRPMLNLIKEALGNPDED